MSTCKGCGAEVLWVKTPAGKSMPLDAAPVTLWVVENDGGKLVSADVRARGVIARRSHFETCPKADEFRRGRG